MDVAQTFNNELQSLLEHKPPVSKAKMGLVTKAAMRGNKYYKHIVHYVEKFVARCRPEYKLSGLYVIDSIVRQSRHQFGIDRDLYGARFARNLTSTFENLFSACPVDDRSKIVRVLNLWQKNRVFSSQVLGPLFDIANPFMTDSLPNDLKSPSSGDTSNSMKQDLHSSHRNNYSGPTREGGDALNFSKVLLDFDYGDEEEDADETPTEAEPPLSSTLSKIEMELRSRHLARVKGAPYPPSHKQASLPPDPDPVLERWNRILKGEMTNEQVKLSNNYILNHKRSCSRSPPAITQQRQPQQQPQQKPQQEKSSHPRRDIPASIVKAEKDSNKGSDKSDKAHETSTKTSSESSKERERKGLPIIRDLHLTVCSSTLWLGHVPKSISEADISDAFGEFGTINSIDLIPPRGCAYICMDRRQDAKKALKESRRLKLKGSHIKMAWAPGKGLQDHKKLKDFWESDVGASFIPYSKVDDMIDFDHLEEGGVIDEDSMSMEMRLRRERKSRGKGSDDSLSLSSIPTKTDMPYSLPLFNQPPPTTPSSTMSIQPFAMSPPPLALGIPPPVLIGGQGVIPFPPPSVGMTSSSGHRGLPPPPIFAHSSSDSSEPRDHELSMVDRQIGMLDRQVVSMIQQGQVLGHQNPGFIFHPNQANPMIYNLAAQHPHMIHVIHPMLDPHNPMAMFDGQNHPALMGSHQHLSMAHSNQDMSIMDENFMKPQHRDF